MRSKYFQADIDRELRQGQFRLRTTVFELDSDGLIDAPALIFVGEWSPKLRYKENWHKEGSHVCEAYFENIDDALKFVDEVRIELHRLDELKEAKLSELEMIPT